MKRAGLATRFVNKRYIDRVNHWYFGLFRLARITQGLSYVLLFDETVPGLDTIANRYQWRPCSHMLVQICLSQCRDVLILFLIRKSRPAMSMLIAERLMSTAAQPFYSFSIPDQLRVWPSVLKLLRLNNHFDSRLHHWCTSFHTNNSKLEDFTKTVIIQHGRHHCAGCGYKSYPAKQIGLISVKSFHKVYKRFLSEKCHTGFQPSRYLLIRVSPHL